MNLTELVAEGYNELAKQALASTPLFALGLPKLTPEQIAEHKASRAANAIRVEHFIHDLKALCAHHGVTIAGAVSDLDEEIAIKDAASMDWIGRIDGNDFAWEAFS